jgi:hypothetical protein
LLKLTKQVQEPASAREALIGKIIREVSEAIANPDFRIVANVPVYACQEAIACVAC